MVVEICTKVCNFCFVKTKLIVRLYHVIAMLLLGKVSRVTW